MTSHERPFGRCLEDFVVGDLEHLPFGQPVDVVLAERASGVAAVNVIHGDPQLAVELAERGGHERPAFKIAGVGESVAGGEIVRAVEHDIEPPDDRPGVGRVQP